MANPNKPHPSAKRINALVLKHAALTGVSPDEIRGEGRTFRIMAPRHACWRDLRREGFGFAPIARAWGCDHTTILHAERTGWRHAKDIPEASPEQPPLSIWARPTWGAKPEPERRAG